MTRQHPIFKFLNLQPDEKIIHQQKWLNETSHTMNIIFTIGKYKDNELISVRVSAPIPLPVPSASTIKAEIEPFTINNSVQERFNELIKKNPNIDLNDRVFDINYFLTFPDKKPQRKSMLYSELFEKYSVIEAENQLHNGQTRGTCEHRQFEHYVNNGEIVGCMCSPIRENGKPVFSHKKAFENWRIWFENFVKEHNIVEHHTEVPLCMPNYSLTGIYDVKLIGKRYKNEKEQNDKNGDYDLITYWGDWKTTDERHPQMEIMQIIIYRYLETQNFNVDFDKERFFVYNSNQYPDGIHRADTDEDADFRKKTGYFQEFTQKEVEIGIKYAIVGIQRWNRRPLAEKLSIGVSGWNLDEIADAHLEAYTDEDMLIPLPENANEIVAKINQKYGKEILFDDEIIFE